MRRRIARHAVAASDTNGSTEITLYRGEDALGTGSGIGTKKDKKVIGTKSATATVAEIPGMAPAKMPNTQEPRMTARISHRKTRSKAAKSGSMA